MTPDGCPVQRGTDGYASHGTRIITKTFLGMSTNFPRKLVPVYGTIMELMPSKRVILGVTWAKVAKLPWGPPKGHLAGGECFAPCFG